MKTDNSDNAVSHDHILKKLGEIWESVLQLKDVDIHSSFVDLGGDSLGAMSCISRLRTAFGVEFTIWDFFMENSTISDFALGICRAGTIRRD